MVNIPDGSMAIGDRGGDITRGAREWGLAI